MKKMGTKSIQFHPYLRVNNEQIPTIDENEEFVFYDSHGILKRLKRS